MTQATLYTTEDLSAALYADLIDGLIQSEHDAIGKVLTPIQAIYQNESEFFHDTLKNFREVWDEQQQDWVFIETLFNLDTKEDAAIFMESIVTPHLAKYQRGRDILQTCSIISSHRSTCLGDNAYDGMTKKHRVVSPIIRVSAGYIATSGAECYLALALKKGVE